MLKAVAIDLLSVLAILSSMILIPILVIAVIAVGIALFKMITEKMLNEADSLSETLYVRKRAEEEKDVDRQQSNGR